MEDLTKHQLILLTLLVSFVTSIATGIITFTLLQEAPVEVTQTINRVVERTIEKVTPIESAGGKEIVREVQVVSEEDLVLESIDKSADSIVRLKTIGFDGAEVFAGLGVVVSNGVIMTDQRNLGGSSGYKVIFSDGKFYNTAKSWSDGEFAFFNVGVPSSEKYVFHPAVLGKTESLKLGQTVIAVGGKTSNAVSIGRISQKENSAEGLLTGIITDISSAKSLPGSPLFDLSGAIVGFESGTNEDQAVLFYTSANIAKESIEKAVKELAK